MAQGVLKDPKRLSTKSRSASSDRRAQPRGLPEISRGLSEATPPAGNETTFAPRQGCQNRVARSRDCATLPGSCRVWDVFRGYRSCALNPRLISGKPPACDPDNVSGPRMSATGYPSRRTFRRPTGFTLLPACHLPSLDDGHTIGAPFAWAEEFYDSVVEVHVEQVNRRGLASVSVVGSL